MNEMDDRTETTV